jgi:transcriptional regulator with PAS, ATPase and Fis domain
MMRSNRQNREQPAATGRLSLVSSGRLTVADPRRPGCSVLVGESDVMARLRQRVLRIAATEYPVLIVGETGTGKELVARELHDCSRRSAGPFVAINCGAIVSSLLEADLFGIEDGTATGVRGRKGKFELARGGTLFLDEIGELSPSGQVSLLRVLQDRTVERVGSHRLSNIDVRVIAATHQDLDGRVATQLFREDLLQRLRVLDLHLPPLRDRGDDVLLLARVFLKREDPKQPRALAPDAAAALCAFRWPGNVRELEHAMQYVVALSDGPRVSLAHLPEWLTGKVPHPASLRVVRPLVAVIVEHVVAVVRAHDGNLTRASQELGISYRTLKYYLGSPRTHRAALRVGRAA